MLANDASLRLSGTNRRYSVWDNPHLTGPRMLGMQDLDAMVGSGGDFARKFDATLDGAAWTRSTAACTRSERPYGRHPSLALGKRRLAADDREARRDARAALPARRRS